jgi:hypothetical protein
MSTRMRLEPALSQVEALNKSKGGLVQVEGKLAC